MSEPFLETSGQRRHAAYAALAAEGPVHQVTLFTGAPAWLMTGYAEVRELLAHPGVVRNALDLPHSAGAPDWLKLALDQHMLTANPPDHTRLRRLVAAAFTRRRVEALEPRIREIVTELLDAMAHSPEPVDLVQSFSYPLPMTVITELIGIPPAMREDFHRWSAVVVNGPVQTRQNYVEAGTALVTALRTLIADKRNRPADDLLSALIEAGDDGDRLSQDELTSMMFLLIAAGHETVTNLITTSVYTLLEHPEQLAALRAEPERVVAAVEESLRYDGAVQVTTPSFTAQPVTVAGQTIPAGEMVLLAVLSANRDPRQFEDPASFDLTRQHAGHLAFGHGIHHCLGAPLARLEAKVALSMLFERYPGLRRTGGEPPRKPDILLNTITELPVVIGASV